MWIILPYNLISLLRRFIAESWSGVQGNWQALCPLDLTLGSRIRHWYTRSFTQFWFGICEVKIPELGQNHMQYSLDHPDPGNPDSFGPTVVPVFWSLSESPGENRRQCVLRDWRRWWIGKSQPVINYLTVKTWPLECRSSLSLLFRYYSEVIATQNVPLLLLVLILILVLVFVCAVKRSI